MCDVAIEHEMLAIPEVADFAPAWVVVTPVPARIIRGLARPVEVVELGVGDAVEVPGAATAG